MKAHLTKVSLALLSAAFLLNCQDQGSGPVGPEGLGPEFIHKGEDKVHGGPKGGGGGDDNTKVTPWSFADARVHDDDESDFDESDFVDDNANTLQSTCSGSPAPKTTNPTVFWNDGEEEGEEEGSTNGCAQVTTTEEVKLTNDAHLIVATKKGSTKFTIQFQIQDVGGFTSIQYRTDRFVIDRPEYGEFTGADFTLHVDTTVVIYQLKGHTGGPKVKPVGTIHIADIVYRN